ncbi:MAG TPA: BON domain-containing protein [Terriglobales bacterium]|jgi:osmotically-inducible protein OsmY
MKLKALTMAIAISIVLMTAACSQQADRSNTSYKDAVKTSLEQADLKDVTVSEDADKNTITLGGALHSEDAKDRATDVAKANAGSRIVVNEISVQPVGQESQAKTVDSNLDDGIESNYKAALTEKGLNKQGIRFDAKNGVLTLKGNVKTTAQRKQAEQLAQNVPNVQQVLNEIDVKR